MHRARVVSCPVAQVTIYILPVTSYNNRRVDGVLEFCVMEGECCGGVAHDVSMGVVCRGFHCGMGVLEGKGKG